MLSGQGLNMEPAMGANNKKEETNNIVRRPMIKLVQTFSKK
jgi:hypothetical protein